MEIFQTIWTALTTPNETLVAILSFPIYFVEAIVNMLLFTTILNIKTTRKTNKNTEVIVLLMSQEILSQIHMVFS